MINTVAIIDRYRVIPRFDRTTGEMSFGLSDSFVPGAALASFTTRDEALKEADRQNRNHPQPNLSPFMPVENVARGVGKWRGRTRSVTPGLAQIAATEGGRILLEPGTYAYDSLTINDGTIYEARVPRSVLITAPNGRPAFLQAPGTTAEFRNIKFDGTALAPIGRCTFRFLGCDFTNFARGADTGFGRGVAIGLPTSSQPRDSWARHCNFHDDPNGWAIGFYRSDGDPTNGDGVIGFEAADCQFVNILNALKANNVGATGFNGRTLRCLFKKIRRCGHELQGCTGGEKYNDNVFYLPNLSGIFHDNDTSFVASLITHGKGQGPAWNEALRNKIIVPEAPDGTGVRLCFEIGNLWRVMFNYARGSGRNTFHARYYGDSNAANSGWVNANPQHFVGEISNNNIDQIFLGGGEGGPHDGRATIVNNGPTVDVGWDINRKDPGPNWITGAGPADPEDPPKMFTLNATPIAATDAEAKAKGARVRLEVTDAPAGSEIEVQFRAKADTTGKFTTLLNLPTVIIPVAAFPVVVPTAADKIGGHPAYEYEARAIARVNNVVKAQTDWKSGGRLAGHVDTAADAANPQGSGLPWPPSTTPTTGDNLDIVTTTTTRVRNGKVIDTSSTTDSKAATS